MVRGKVTKRPRGHRVAKKSQERERGPPRAKRVPSSQDCRVAEGIKQPGERCISLMVQSGKEGDGRPGGRFVGARLHCGCLNQDWVLKHPQRDIKWHLRSKRRSVAGNALSCGLLARWPTFIAFFKHNLRCPEYRLNSRSYC